MVISRDPATSSRPPHREIELTLPPAHRSMLPVVPRLVCHCNVSSERWVLIVAEDVRKDGLEVTSLVINHNLLSGQRQRLLLFEMTAGPICCRAFERVGPFVHAWVTMYVTLTGVQNGEPFYLAKNLSVPSEVALCELTYYHRWLNIGAELENNQVSTGQTTLKIPDGYYNACKLDDVLQPLGTEVRLHAPTGRLKQSAEKRLLLNRRLADLLGFYRNKTYTADEPHRLAVHREICVHFAEISTSENLHNGAPSTLLRSVPVKNERCGGGRTETYPAGRHSKRLASGTVSQLTLAILDTSGRKLCFDHVIATLHIRNV